MFFFRYSLMSFAVVLLLLASELSLSKKNLPVHYTDEFLLTSWAIDGSM